MGSLGRRAGIDELWQRGSDSAGKACSKGKGIGGKFAGRIGSEGRGERKERKKAERMKGKKESKKKIQERK